MKAIVMTHRGAPDVMRIAEMPDPVAGAGQVLVEVAAAGVNFMDIGARQGILWKEMPSRVVLGVEGAGRVIALGEGAGNVQIGDRVAWVYAPGSYAERIAISAEALVPVPDVIDDRTAAATMMQGLTASHFATQFYEVQPGETVFVHAAAGGVGMLLAQISKMRGATVIGRVSSEAKVEVALEAGADHVIVDRQGLFAKQVLRITNGEGAHVVFDGTGPENLEDSIASLRSGGTLAWYGPVLGFDTRIAIGSLPRSVKIGHPVFFDHIPTPERLRAQSACLFDWIASGKLKIHIGEAYPLPDAVRAHMDMENRGSTGKLLLIP